eukprot:CAMPEP_0202859838 /NCGR_PEP_ID=MMETSP1391-20130828/1792_1 /ASSEMBLY_ACC=CAM_ASM_000867 /TAXON_ID=1034604 /ORGANISM="Chlamydomonas leiostraca, Strain SAG 11-49" /LENGTH=440 /DNA_ID=CAMNT_0049538931 /DNA_START=127 /DNA_END=1446 /DNA_ORIENTATION=+
MNRDPPPNSTVEPPWWVRMSRWRPTSQGEAVAAEKGLLGILRSQVAVHDVKVGPGPQDYLHTHTYQPPHSAPGTPSSRPASAAVTTPPAPAVMDAAGLGPGSSGSSELPVVLLPGYGAASGFWFRVVDALASTKVLRVHAVDWLGTGLSGRPPFTAKTQKETESFFLDSLSAWKDNVGLAGSKVVLVGHSLGGYLAAAYALRHPEHVAHLVLVCPAGVPKAPEDWQRKFLGAANGVRGRVFKAAMWAWEKGVTPHSLIRALGPWGPNLCEKYVVGRFSHHGNGLAQSEADVFKTYFYHSIAGRGSGEHALRHLLAPGAWAHEPLSQRLRELKVPVTFIYGAEDWMRPAHAVELCKELRAERAQKVPTDLHCEIIRDAGHFVFLDQPEAFSRALVDALAPHLSHKEVAAAAAALSHTVQGRGDAPGTTSWGPEGGSINTGR